MSNKFVTFLEDLGRDFKNGMKRVETITVTTATDLGKHPVIVKIFVTMISFVDPAAGAILKTTIATIVSIEQKYAAAGQQSGTGSQKLAEALEILEPIIAAGFDKMGKPSDATTVQNYIQSVVDFLNSIPADDLSSLASIASPIPAAEPVASAADAIEAGASQAGVNLPEE